MSNIAAELSTKFQSLGYHEQINIDEIQSLIDKELKFKEIFTFIIDNVDTHNLIDRSDIESIHK